MTYPQLKSPTKAQIDAANSHKQEKAIRADIHKIDAAQQSTDINEVLSWIIGRISRKQKQSLTRLFGTLYGMNYQRVMMKIAFRNTVMKSTNMFT